MVKYSKLISLMVLMVLIVGGIDEVESKSDEFEYPFFFNGSSHIYMNLSKPIMININSIKEKSVVDAGGAKKTILGDLLDTFSINSTDVTVSGTSDTKNNLVQNSLSINYEKLDIEGKKGGKLTKLEIKMDFSINLNTSRWILETMETTFNTQINGTDFSSKNLEIITAPKSGYTEKKVDIAYGRGYTTGCAKYLSWTCNLQMFTQNITDLSTNDKAISVIFPGLRMQPFAKGNKTNISFGYAWDCDPLISTALWEFIFIGLFFIFILYGSLAMLSNLKTPERFDDPKGKPLNIPLSE